MCSFVILLLSPLAITLMGSCCASFLGLRFLLYSGFCFLPPSILRGIVSRVSLSLATRRFAPGPAAEPYSLLHRSDDIGLPSFVSVDFDRSQA